MIDPHFANAGVTPFVPGYGAQQVPVHRHRHRKNKHGAIGGSPSTHDESMSRSHHGGFNYFQQST